MDNIIIAGITVKLKERDKSNLKGFALMDTFRYRFYDFSFQGSQLLLLEAVDKHESPAQCRRTAARIEGISGLKAVFYFEHLLFYERKRLLEHGVFFVSGEKNAYLPNMISGPLNDKKPASKLSAAAQYIIMVHLQKGSLEFKSLKDLANVLPYSYVSVAKAVQNLEELGICRCKREPDGNKAILFNAAGKELWEQAKPFMSSPVKERFYCTGLPGRPFPAAGISALSMCSNLSPDPEKSMAVYAKGHKREEFEDANDFEGPFIVEFWRYPVIGDKMVDKLSLYLALENDTDPRVEKELSFILDSVWKR